MQLNLIALKTIAHDIEREKEMKSKGKKPDATKYLTEQGFLSHSLYFSCIVTNFTELEQFENDIIKSFDDIKWARAQHLNMIHALMNQLNQLREVYSNMLNTLGMSIDTEMTSQ
jgi:hypothetical protein